MGPSETVPYQSRRPVYCRRWFGPVRPLGSCVNKARVCSWLIAAVVWLFWLVNTTKTKLYVNRVAQKATKTTAINRDRDEQLQFIIKLLTFFTIITIIRNRKLKATVYDKKYIKSTKKLCFWEFQPLNMQLVATSRIVILSSSLNCYE